MSTKRIVALGAAGLLGAAALAGCSSSSSPSTSASPSAPASSAAPSESVLPPVMVQEGETSAAAKVGDAIVFEVENPADWTIKSSDTTIVTVTEGGSQGTYVSNPGGEAVAAGTADVTLTPKSGGKAWVVKVTVAA